MLKTYFFIPASKKRFIEKMPTIGADEFVLDLEDAISENECDDAYNNLRQIENCSELIVRPRLYNSAGVLNNKRLEMLIDIGFRRFFIPKAETKECLDDLLNIFNYYEIDDLHWYYLVESPTALMHLKELAFSGHYPLKGICLGSHDYAANMGMSYSLENISWARNYVLNVAKACNVEAIDMASMVLKDKELFEKECHQAFQMGYDSKLVLHPAQLEVVKNLEYYSKSEIELARKIGETVDLTALNDFSVLTIDGMLYERPHINRIIRILDYLKKR